MKSPAPLSALAQSSLLVVGDIGVDLIMGPVQAWPEFGTEALVERSEMRAGGSGGNTAIALRTLGAQATLLAQVGDDPLGAWLAGRFSGIDATLKPCVAATSISVGVLSQDGERAFLTTKGHLEQQTWDALRRHVPPAHGPHSIALLTGAYLLPRMRISYNVAIAELRSAGYQVAIDTGWPPQGWDSPTRSAARAWLECCDHILLNEVEAASLAQTHDITYAIATISNWLAPSASLIVKTGPRGAVGAQSDRRETRVARAIHAFDTVGAGDAFNAGYMLARARGADLGDAVEAGCETATDIIAHFPRGAMQPGELANRGAPPQGRQEP